MIDSIKAAHFNQLIDALNKGIIEGHLDAMTEKFVDALDFYEENDLNIPIRNIFENSSNIIEAVSKRALFLSQLNRVINIAQKNKLIETLGTYYRYFALAQAFYGDLNRGLQIIEEAEKVIDVNSGLFIELRNSKALILSEAKAYEESLLLYEFNYEETQRLNYVPGFRFLHNIGTAYRDLGQYDKAASFIKLGYEYDLKLNYIVNAVNALVELAEVYYRDEKYELALKTLEIADGYEVTTQNQYLYKLYCELMYNLLKKVGRFQEALDYHEIFMGLENQFNMDKYSGMLDEINLKYDLSEKEKENAIIKSKNYDLEMMSKKLENMNKFLKTTLQKSHDMQESLKKKNSELEKTMSSLDMTQEKLVTAEKRSVLDQMFINIAHHMNTPLGVMNTTLSHLALNVEKVAKKFDEGILTKHDLKDCIEDVRKSTTLLNESLKKVVGFVDTLRLYKTSDEEEVVEINVKEHFLKLKAQYEQTLGLEEMEVDCPEDARMFVNVSLLDKCVDLLSGKILASTERNGFDIEVSKEINMISIGLGDFSKRSAVKHDENLSIVDSYDFYIIQTIVENLLKGRFIKFEDRGKDYFQFIFQEN